MPTYADMRSRIAEELANDGDITSTQIDRAIQSAIQDYEGEAFWFNQKVGTFATVAAQELYTASDFADIPNIISLRSVRLVGSGKDREPIEGVDNNSIEDIQDGTVTGEPRLYSRFENKLRLYPIPSSVYTVKMSYIYRLAALVNDTDTNAWTEDCEEMIRQAAKKRLCLDILLADDMAARCAMLEKEAYAGVRKENRLRSPQSYLRTDLPFGRRSYEFSRWRG
jgi:hypothetical protein